MTASLFSFYKGGVIELFYYLLRTWWLTDSCLTLNSKASNDDDDLRGASTMVYYSVRNMDESSWVELSQAESSWVELPFSWKMCKMTLHKKISWHLGIFSKVNTKSTSFILETLYSSNYIFRCILSMQCFCLNIIGNPSSSSWGCSWKFYKSVEHIRSSEIR